MERENTRNYHYHSSQNTIYYQLERREKSNNKQKLITNGMMLPVFNENWLKTRIQLAKTKHKMSIYYWVFIWSMVST